LADRSQIFRYHEKPFAQKLDILYQRNLYVLAINLAQKAGLDASQQNVILRKFGDYLYSKQDYDTAMQQYLKAIDNTEPSQVIRKASSIPDLLVFATNIRPSSWIHKGYTI
jgi:tetratricopeptide (TPR) repeat protein